VRPRKSAYELSQSQVNTPPSVVSLFWTVVANYRPVLRTVLDFGAGDCRFVKGCHAKEYVGVEIDASRSSTQRLPEKAKCVHSCAFEFKGRDFDACVGNPPYARHHDIEKPWKSSIADKFKLQLSLTVDKRWNLYLYFLALACLKTKADGLIALIIPYEWVARPAAATLRGYLLRHKWNVSVYRFTNSIFPGVLTTACITIIDKSTTQKKWTYYEIDQAFRIRAKSDAGARYGRLIRYRERGPIWSMRGLSPGTQKVFTLTERQRLDAGLSLRDVDPCITSLRHVPATLSMLNQVTFRKYFIDSGKRCWLVRSNLPCVSDRLLVYLRQAPKSLRSNTTCAARKPWYRFRAQRIPELVLSSGFVTQSPKILINSIRAHAIGAVSGIHLEQRFSARKIQKAIHNDDFSNRVVGYAKTLKKLEVGQLNCVLCDLVKTPSKTR